MTKDELISRLAKSGNVTKKQVEQMLTGLAEIVTESLQKGERTVLPGIGALTSCEKKARTGRNPRTGVEIQIPAKTTAKFSMAAALARGLEKAEKSKID